MQLKLKKRVLDLTLYEGEKIEIRYPTNSEHDVYVDKIIAKPEDEREITKEFFMGLGMSEEVFNTLQKPDIFEVGMILTGQKKI